jgi:hypothetical protein
MKTSIRYLTAAALFGAILAITGCDKSSNDKMVGMYGGLTNTNETLELKKDGTFRLNQFGRITTGRYQREGTNITFIVEMPEHCAIDGDTIMDIHTGVKWSRK